MVTDLVEEFERIDGELRIVVTLNATSWEIDYIRDSLRDEYEDGDFERAYRNLMANQVSSEDFSHVGDFGEFVGEVYFFGKIVVFQFPSARYEGMFVSYDWDDSFPVKDVIELAEEIPGGL